MAFMNNTAEPELPLPTPEQTAQRAKLVQDIAAAQAKLPLDKKKFEAWLKTHQAETIDWRFLRPTSKSHTQLAEIEQDDSIFVQGDASKHDTYELEFANLPAGITALRLEALPDERLPKNGPGRAYYEGPRAIFS